MVSGSAADSLRYAFQGELLKLDVVVVAGFLVVDAARTVFGIVPYGLLRMLVRTPVEIAGWALAAGGTVAVIHYVVADTAVR